MITEPAEDDTDRLNAAGFGLATRLPERPHWRKSGLSFMSSRTEPIVYCLWMKRWPIPIEYSTILPRPDAAHSRPEPTALTSPSLSEVIQ